MWLRRNSDGAREICVTSAAGAGLDGRESAVDIAIGTVQHNGEAVHLQVAHRFGAGAQRQHTSGRVRLDNSAMCSGKPADPIPRSSSAISRAVASTWERGTGFVQKIDESSLSQLRAGKGGSFCRSRNVSRLAQITIPQTC